MSIRELFGGGPILEFPPTATAEQGEVLTVGPNQALIWAAVTAEGTVTGTTNQIDVTSAGGNVTVALDPGYVNVPGALGYNATNDQSMQFPTQRGSADQVLATDGAGTLYWTNQTGGGGDNIAGTTNQIKAVSASGTTTLSFDTSTVIPGALTINAATTPMAFPTSNGGAGQLLSTNGSGQLAWVSETTSGTVAGTANQILASTVGNTTTLSFDTNTNIPGKLTVNTAGSYSYSLPIIDGAPGQVIAWPPTGTQCVWEDAGGSITGTGGQIDVSTVGGNSTISLDPALVIPGSIKIGNYNMPTAAGAAGTVLTSAGANQQLTWAAQSSSGSITGTTGQIDVTTNGGNSIISIDSNLALPGSLTIGTGASSYTFPTTRGTAGQVLETNASGIVTWQTASGSSGVTELTTSDANVGLSAATGQVAINLANPPTYGPASQKYELPTALVSPTVGADYGFKVSSIANGTAVLSFEPGTAGGITGINAVANQIVASAPAAGVVTIGLAEEINFSTSNAAISYSQPSLSTILKAGNLTMMSSASNFGVELSTISGITVYTTTGNSYVLPITQPVSGQVLTAGASGVCSWASPGAASAITGNASPIMPIGTQSSVTLPVTFNVLSAIKTLSIDFIQLQAIQFQSPSDGFTFQTNPIAYPAGCAPSVANVRQTLGQVYWYTYSAAPGSVFQEAGTAWLVLDDTNQSTFILWLCLNQNNINTMQSVKPTQILSINGTNAGNVAEIATRQTFTYI